MKQNPMIRWVVGFALVAIIVSLSACVQHQDRMALMATAHAEDEVDREGLDNWMLMAGGMPIEELIVQREEARRVLLEVLGYDYDDEQLAELLAMAREDDVKASDLPDALTGIPGFTVLQLLEAYLEPELERKVSGKIRHYYFNDDNKGGYLEVDTVVDTLRDGEIVHTDTYFWAIAVRPETFEVVPRCDINPDDPNGCDDNGNAPFLDTLALPAKRLDPNDPEKDSIWQRGLDHKLWAEGTGIVVVGVIRNGVLLSPDHHPLYVSNEDSCIDLMFAGYPPVSELPPQPGYCLGRCAHPEVVNTH